MMRTSAPAPEKIWDQPVVKLIDLPMEQLVQVLQLQLQTGGVALLTVTGTSMYPTFCHRRDKVILSLGAPRKYDTVLYKRDSGEYILHRIVKKEDCFLCCGDNQWQTEAVREDQILAVAVGFERKGERFSVDHWNYTLWVRLWTWLLPVRKPILAARYGLGKIRRAMLRRN